uniref:DIRP domain-containing protein n=1 Tax=Panagrellus redivivus TaxID=6233 RepID=A0A7E4ZXD4_PANRE
MEPSSSTTTATERPPTTSSTGLHFMNNVFRRPSFPIPPHLKHEQPSPSPGSRGSTENVAVDEVASSSRDQGNHYNSDYSAEMVSNVHRLKQALKLPKTRRFAFCEFFYSPVDTQIFLAENEFLSLVKENLPNLRTKNLRRCEWRVVRRLIGKPRRLSANFLAEERRVLEAKRSKIQAIYRGTATQLDPDSIDLPAQLPRPLMVGTKVLVKVGGYRDSVFAGTVDATEPTGYRVVFDKPDLPTLSCREDQVMCTQNLEVLSVAYFLSTNKANMKAQLPGGGDYAYHTPAIALPATVGYTADPQTSSQQPSTSGIVPRAPGVKDDKVGNFPVRLLVIVVKMCKLLEHKRTTLKLLKLINDEAVKMHRYGETYPAEFVTAHAEVTVDLESINKMLRVYSEALSEYKTTLNPQRTRAVPTDKPDALRRTCHNHASQIMKHCSSSIVVKSPSTKEIITKMSSLLLQIRFLGQHAMNSRSCAEEVQILKDSMTELKNSMPPEAYQAFEDGVEIHLKQIFNTLLKVRPQSSQTLHL